MMKLAAISLSIVMVIGISAYSITKLDANASEVPVVLHNDAAANATHQSDFETILVSTPQSEKAATKPTPQNPLLLKYDDNKPDGKKSLGGSGEMIRFTMPEGIRLLRGIKIHGSRYGTRQPPQESFFVYILSDDGEEIISTKMAPYSKFKRGKEKWVTIPFKKPVEVPESFWLVIDFKAGRTKGVYVSYDTSTEGKYSKTGLPGKEAHDVNFAGDWMIQALLKK